MASKIEGSECDIFVSYRQNENLSEWVTKFVEAMQEKIAAILKELFPIYFDTILHDSIFKPQYTNKWLEGMIKCLIFIPVISNPSCDSQTYA